MSRKVRYNAKALADLHRLYDFLLDRDVKAAERALNAIVSGITGLIDFPNTGRKVEHDGQEFRELPISFGRTGYLALYQLADNGDVQILAIRHQREDDYR